MQMEITTRDEVRGVQMWMAKDLWVSLGFASNAFEEYVERVGWADTWSALLHLAKQVKPSHWEDREPNWL